MALLLLSLGVSPPLPPPPPWYNSSDNASSLDIEANFDWDFYMQHFRYNEHFSFTYVNETYLLFRVAIRCGPQRIFLPRFKVIDKVCVGIRHTQVSHCNRGTFVRDEIPPLPPSLP